MAKFMILYRSPASAREQMANATPEEAKAGMDAWMAWAGKAGSAVVDLGSPLTHGTHVGPGRVAADDIAGYSILQAVSLQAVEAVLDGHPHLHMPGGCIEVLELLSIPGM
jgi:hypothetical protein